MTARIAAAAGSLALAMASAGCLSFYEISVETPIHAKLDVTSFQRVLVLGFLGGGSNNLDANAETARLLRSQLRTKSEMRVIDTDVLSLVDEVDRRRGAAGQPAASAAPTTPDELKIKDETDLAGYEEIFNDAEYWKRIGAEHQSPLIVTGSVLFTEISKSGQVSRLKTAVDSMGRPTYTEERAFANLRGYALSPKFVFIDGRTGELLHTESFHEEALYQDSQNTPALSSYFELMDKLLPGFLNTLSTQKIRGSRYLLK
jgi:hypothetical protein